LPVPKRAGAKRTAFGVTVVFGIVDRGESGRGDGVEEADRAAAFGRDPAGADGEPLQLLHMLRRVELAQIQNLAGLDRELKAAAVEAERPQILP
jgi:hypothetical protein